MRALLLLVVLLAGCTAPAALPPPASLDPWAGNDRQLLVELPEGFIQESDVACVFGGGVELERDGGLVLAGADRIEATASVDPTFTGLQVGWSLDGADVTWLEPFPSGTTTREVPVGADQAEPPERWSFYYQMNLPSPATQPCYTGGGAGSWGLRIEAVRGP